LETTRDEAERGKEESREEKKETKGKRRGTELLSFFSLLDFHLLAPRRACRGASRGPRGRWRGSRRGAARIGPAAAAAAALGTRLRPRRRRQPLRAAEEEAPLRACAASAASAASAAPAPAASVSAAAWGPWCRGCSREMAFFASKGFCERRESEQNRLEFTPIFFRVGDPEKTKKGLAHSPPRGQVTFSPAVLPRQPLFSRRLPPLLPLDGHHYKEFSGLCDRKVSSERLTRRERLRCFSLNCKVPPPAEGLAGFCRNCSSSSLAPAETEEPLSMPSQCLLCKHHTAPDA
jgi:hypothetical protein